MHITAQAVKSLRNDLYCVKWDVKLYYTIPYLLGRCAEFRHLGQSSPATPLSHLLIRLCSAAAAAAASAAADSRSNILHRLIPAVCVDRSLMLRY